MTFSLSLSHSLSLSAIVALLTAPSERPPRSSFPRAHLSSFRRSSPALRLYANLQFGPITDFYSSALPFFLLLVAFLLLAPLSLPPSLSTRTNQEEIEMGAPSLPPPIYQPRKKGKGRRVHVMHAEKKTTVKRGPTTTFIRDIARLPKVQSLSAVPRGSSCIWAWRSLSLEHSIVKVVHDFGVEL